MANTCADHAAKFIAYLLALLEKNKGAGARLRRADNPATEHMAWEYLARFNVDLNNERQRKAFALVAAALAKAKPQQDGAQSLGKALYGAYGDAGGQDGQHPAAARMSRLLGCESFDELAPVLRPMLQLIAAKTPGNLSYAALLTDLLYFNEKTKQRWAQDFYSVTPKAQQEETP